MRRARVALPFVVLSDRLAGRAGDARIIPERAGAGSRKGIDERDGLGCELGAVVLVLGEHVDTLPPPVDAMGSDEAVFDLHDLDEVHLLAVGRLARVLPSRAAPVGKETRSVILANLGGVRATTSARNGRNSSWPRQMPGVPRMCATTGLSRTASRA